MIGKNKKRVVLKTPKSRVLSVAHLYDCEGNEVVQDKDRDVYYTVLLSKKNPMAKRGSDEPDEVRYSFPNLYYFYDDPDFSEIIFMFSMEYDFNFTEHIGSFY